MKTLIATCLLLAPTISLAQECLDCPCDPDTPRVVLYDDYGNQVLITSRMPGVDPDDYKIDWLALDADGDGLLSRAEVAGAQDGSRGAHNLMLEFQVADHNGDKRLSPVELVHWHGSGSGRGW